MITFSGIDCSGKSTQIKEISSEMVNDKNKIKVIWSRGGYTPGIEFIKNIIRKDKKHSIKDKDAYRETIHKSKKKRRVLLFASILDLIFYYGVYYRVIELFGTTIIADRYIWDTYIDFKLKYNEFNFEGWIVWRLLILVYYKPKTSIIYVVSADESMRRSIEKNEPFPETLNERETRLELYFKLIDGSKWGHCIEGSSSVQSIKMKSMEIIFNENKYYAKT